MSTSSSGKVNALIGSFSKGTAPPIKTGPMPPPGRKNTKEVPVEEDPNLTEEEKILKKKGFNTDSLNSGSLHRRRKANSKLALDKVNKNFAGTTDSIEIDAKGQAIGGQSTLGKKTIKKLGFQMAKASHINFYDHWKQDDYPDTVVHIFETLMKSVGVGGVPKPDEEDWVGDFMEKLHTKLSVQSQHNYGVIPKNFRKLMPSMWEESQALLERQKKLERIVKIQSVFRGYYARKELREWLNEPDVKFTKSKRHQCNLAFRDLLKAETDYNNDLKSAVENFLWPLRQMSTESAKRNSTIDLSFWTSGTPPVVLAKEDIDAIFSNMEILLATHQRILKKLVNLRETWPFFDNVGEVFLKLVRIFLEFSHTQAPQLIPYGDYVANSKHALDTLVRLQSTDPKFNAFMNAMSQNEKDLMGYLVRPLNHITQYALYLKVVKKNTPSEDPGMEHVRNAYLAIKKTKQFIQEYYETAGNRAKIAEIQRQLISPRNTPYELSGKTFLQQGHVTIAEKGLVMTSDKKKSFFLFNDLLLLCDDNGKKVTHEFPLKEIQFENDVVVCNGQKTVFAEKSEIVKKIKEINDTLTNSHKGGKFPRKFPEM